ncbi:MAG: hypothetical protein HC934_03800 [Acaryochloridaceae cyanobacterium SU_2_1]|nr:hypothetical protein [Acaryochloridaceae cyanobacterium SU_2_1]
MVRLLPKTQFIFQTPKPLQSVIQCLEAQVEAPKQWRWVFNSTSALYEGSISETGFTIRRLVTNRRNSFVPNITGCFQTASGGTQVKITMQLDPWVSTFLGSWSLIWYSGCLLIWFTQAMTSDLFLVFVGLPLFMFVAFWLAFWLEVERSRADLMQMLLERIPESRQKKRFLLRFLFGSLILLSNIFVLGVFMNNRFSGGLPPWQGLPERLPAAPVKPEF